MKIVESGNFSKNSLTQKNDLYTYQIHDFSESTDTGIQFSEISFFQTLASLSI